MTDETMSNSKQQRNTPQRRIILEELQKVDSHPTAVEVFELVRRRLPKISLGTVYRNLERLAAGGKIQKLSLSGSEARFDGDLHPHYHVRCVQCGHVSDIHGLEGDMSAIRVQEAGGYKILGHRLEFVGVCPDCQTERSADTGGFAAEP